MRESGLTSWIIYVDCRLFADWDVWHNGRDSMRRASFSEMITRDLNDLRWASNKDKLYEIDERMRLHDVANPKKEFMPFLYKLIVSSLLRTSDGHNVTINTVVNKYVTEEMRVGNASNLVPKSCTRWWSESAAQYVDFTSLGNIIK